MDPSSYTVYVDDWLGPYLGSLQQLNDAHGRPYDLEGYRLAVADLIGAEAAQEVASERISAAADLLLDLHDAGLQRFMASLQQDRRFPAVVRRLECLLRTEQGSSRASASLRLARRDAVAELLDVLATPVEQRLGQLAHANAGRERRQFVRFPLMPEEGLTLETRALDPSMVAMVSESAARIVSRLRVEVRPQVFAALRSLLISTDTRRDLAAGFGISEATISRAWTRFAALARQEAQGLPDECGRLLSSSIVTAFSEVA